MSEQPRQQNPVEPLPPQPRLPGAQDLGVEPIVRKPVPWLRIAIAAVLIYVCTTPIVMFYVPRNRDESFFATWGIGALIALWILDTLIVIAVIVEEVKKSKASGGAGDAGAPRFRMRSPRQRTPGGPGTGMQP